MGGDAGKGDKYCPVLISENEWERLWNIAFPPKSKQPSHSVIMERDPGDENDYKQE